MRYILSSPVHFLILFIITISDLYAHTYTIHAGWNLLGTTEKLELRVFNNSCVKDIWSYQNSWELYKPFSSLNMINKLDKGIGFWAYSDTDCTIDIGSKEQITGPKEQIKRLTLTSRENGYTNFETSAITSGSEFLSFINTIESEEKSWWTDKETFLSNIKNETINFETSNLIILRIDEPSGSIKLIPQTPNQLSSSDVSIEIEEQKPYLQTADFVNHAFFYIVDKSFSKIIFQIGIREEVEFNFVNQNGSGLNTQIKNRTLINVGSIPTRSTKGFVEGRENVVTNQSSYDALINDLYVSLQNNGYSDEQYHDASWFMSLKTSNIDFKNYNLIFKTLFFPYRLGYALKTYVKNGDYKIIIEDSNETKIFKNQTEMYVFSYKVSKDIDKVILSVFDTNETIIKNREKLQLFH